MQRIKVKSILYIKQVWKKHKFWFLISSPYSYCRAPILIFFAMKTAYFVNLTMTFSGSLAELPALTFLSLLCICPILRDVKISSPVWRCLKPVVFHTFSPTINMGLSVICFERIHFTFRSVLVYAWWKYNETAILNWHYFRKNLWLSHIEPLRRFWLNRDFFNESLVPFDWSEPFCGLWIEISIPRKLSS